MSRQVGLSVAVCLILFGISSAFAATWYVDDDAPNDPGPGDPAISDPLENGSPAHPYDSIHEAIVVSGNDDIVLVLDGIYTGTGNRDLLLYGKAITIKSRNGPSNCIIDCQASATDQHRAFWVDGGEGPDTIFEGLTFKNGYKGGDGIHGAGGAIYCRNTSPTIRDCYFINNYATGGGALRIQGSGSRVTNCEFHKNTSDYGGAISFRVGCATIIDCTFAKNYSTYDGGALFIYEADPNILNCTLEDNDAERYGGAIDISNYSDPNVIGCTITENTAEEGGGIFSYYYSTPGIDHCLFSGNSADYGGAIRTISASHPQITFGNFIGNQADDKGGGIANDGSSNPIIENSIFRKNIDSSGMTESAQINGGAPSVSHTCIQGLSTYVGNGNIGGDPLFAVPGFWHDNSSPGNPDDDYWVDGDYHLQSQAGRYDPAASSWVTDSSTSPGIDAGDPLSPIAFEPFPNGGIVNLGIFGQTDQASKSYFGTTPCSTIITGDLNGDCIVNLLDYALMAIHWLEEGI
jgi:predicted outer membrane repeat protein